MSITIACPECSGRFQFTEKEQSDYKGKNWAQPTRCKQCRDHRKGLPVYSHPRWPGLKEDVAWDREQERRSGFRIPSNGSQHALAYILVKKEAAKKMQDNWKSTDSEARKDGLAALTLLPARDARYFCVCDTSNSPCHGWFDVAQDHEPEHKCTKIHRNLATTPKPEITLCADGKTWTESVEKRSVNLYNGHVEVLRRIAENDPDYLLVGVKYLPGPNMTGDDFQTFISESSKPSEHPGETPFQALQRGLSEEVQITMTEEVLRRVTLETGQCDFSRRYACVKDVYFIIRIESSDDYECVTRSEVHEKTGGGGGGP